MKDDLFTDEPLPTAAPDDLFSDEPAPDRSAMGFVKNVGTDVMDIAKGVGGLGKRLVTENPLKVALEVGTNIPGALWNEAERLGAVGTGGFLRRDEGGLGLHPIEGAKKFGAALYDKPFTTALDVLPGIAAAGKAVGLGKKASMAGTAAEEAATLADDAVRAATTGADDLGRVATGAPEPLTMPGEAAEILKRAPEPPPPSTGAQAAPGDVPMGATFQETVQNLTNKIPKEVKGPLDQVSDFLAQKYGQAAKTPGAIQNFGKALEQRGKGMFFKEVGTPPGVMRTMRDRFGEKAIESLHDWGESKGITSGFFNYQTGAKIKNILDQSGKEIGAIRDLSSKRGAVHPGNSLVKAIREELDPIYLKGSGSSQKGAYLKALDDIKNSPKDAASVAETLTAKNKLVKKNKAFQSIGAPTDVYNTASRLNNELIGRHLNKAEKMLYENALKDHSASKMLDRMYSYTFGRDMAGRTGPGSLMNSLKDIGGRKIMEKVFKGLGRGMQKSPERYKNPVNLATDMFDSMSDAVDEIIEQMGPADVAR